MYIQYTIHYFKFQVLFTYAIDFTFSLCYNGSNTDREVKIMLWDFTKEKLDIIIQAGQSNAEGCGKGDVPNPYVPVLDILHLENDYSITPARERIEVNHVCAHFGLTFAKKYIEDGRLEEGRKILIIRSAVGGTGFSDHRWGMTDDLYLKMMDMSRTALELNPENRIVAFLWHQGETDAINHMGEEEYHENLTRLFNSVRAEFGKDIPIVCGDFVQEWEIQDAEICAPIISAQRKIVTEINDAAFVETDGLESNRAVAKIEEDNIHFCRRDQYILGERYYKAYTEILSRK